MCTGVMQASILTTFSAKNEVLIEEKSQVVITFCFQRQFPLAIVPFVSKEVIDWSPNLQINILSEFIFFLSGQQC